MGVIQSFGLLIILSMIFMATFSNWAGKQGWAEVNPFFVFFVFMLGMLMFAVGIVVEI